MTRELFVLTSMVADWSGQGPAIISWTHEGRAIPSLPYATIIRDYDNLSSAEQDAVERASRRFLTRHEARALGDYLRLVCPAWCTNLRFGIVELPLYAEEAVAMQPLDPATDPHTLSLLKPLEESAIVPPIPFLGNVSRWPWADLEPGDVAALIDLRHRLGLDAVPPSPASEPGICP